MPIALHTSDEFIRRIYFSQIRHTCWTCYFTIIIIINKMKNNSRFTFMATLKHLSLLLCSFPLFFGFSSPADSSAIGDRKPASILSCDDLKGIGSLNTTCQLSYSLNFTSDVNITGTGNLFVLHGVSLTCPDFGCQIVVNISGEFRLNPFAEIVAGSVYLVSGNASLFDGSVVNVTARGGDPPDPSTGTPDKAEGGGGGHGGRGASCVVDNKKRPEDEWGGDAYSWDSLDEPQSFGSRGDTTNRNEDYGGRGGGRIWLEGKDIVDVRGMLLADGGEGGIKGGGGSGGSIYIKSKKMYYFFNLDFLVLLSSGPFLW